MSQRQIQRGQSETIYFEDSAGNRFETIGNWFYTNVGNFGAPPVQYETRTFYQQTGQAVLGYALQPRLIPISLGHPGDDLRRNYWALRAELLEFFAVNRGQLTMTLARADASKRSIHVRYDSGLEQAPEDPDAAAQWNIRAGLTLIAHNPIWFNPTATTIAPSAGVDSHLVFPITFPIQFGTAGTAFDTGIIDYGGSWRTYPTITLTGPYTTARIENLATGAVLRFQTSISEGETRHVTLAEDSIAVTNQDGDNAMNELHADSNLLDFYIPPAIEVIEGGTLQITAIFESGSVDSAMSLTYYERFYGV
jgi:hypothetical protein